MYQYHHADEIVRPYNSNAIWIGDLTSAQQINWLRQNNIKTVITAAEGVTLKYDKSIYHIHYKLKDIKSQNISNVIEEAADKIEKNIKNGSVLVHCGAGVSRSSTLVIGYLLKYKKMGFIQALKFTKSKRPVICPNLGFQLQLKSFQKLLKSRQLINAIKQKNFQLPEIQKPNIINQKAIKLSGKVKQNRLQMKNNNDAVDGFVSRLKIRRENSLAVGNRNYVNRQLQSNVLQDSQMCTGSNTENNTNQRQSKDIQNLRKMAVFRFGITNTQKWRLG